MINKKDIIKAYVQLRKTNISPETLEFIRETCLAKLSEKSEVHVCTDFTLKFSDMRFREEKIIQRPTGDIFTIQITSR